MVDPAHTAVLTMELQRAVIGDLAALDQLRDAAAAAGTIDAAAAVCAAARTAGAAVVHCNAEFRPDRRGSAINARILAASLALNGDRLDVGSPGVDNVAELAVADSDLVVRRSHGLTPFVATELDQLLRNMDVSTVVAVGASINVGILGLVLVAVDLGYQVVVVRDAVIGVPEEYGAAVLDHTISLLATLTTADELAAAWSEVGG